MKKTFKNLVALGMVGIMAFSMSACDFSKDDTEVITWYMQKPIDNMSDQELVENAANEIIEKELGVKVEFHFFDSASYNDKMNVMIASGEVFDICMTNSWTNNYVNNVKRGAFLELTDLLDKYGADIKSKTDPIILESFKVDGGVYGVRAQMPNASTISRVYRKDLVEKYNFDYKNAKTLESMEPFLAQVKANEPGVTPILVTGNGPIATFNEIYTDDSVPGLLFNEETCEYEYIYNATEVIDNYRVINDFYKKGYISSDAATKTEYMSEAKSGNYAVLKTAGSYTEDGSKSSDLYGFPCVETFLGQTLVGTSGLFEGINAISVTSKHPEKAMQLMNLIWKNRDLSNLLAYGIENVHYVVDEERSAEINDKSVIPQKGSEQTWAIWHNWIGPLWDQWDSSWNTKEALEEFQEINKNAVASKSLGFVFDNTPVKTECAQVNAVLQEIRPVLNTGSMPDFDEYISACEEKLKKSGIEKIYIEANKQFKEWNSNK